MKRTNTAYLRDFRKAQSMSQDESFTWKRLETAWVAPHIGWGSISRNHQGGETSVSQVGGDSYMGLTHCNGTAQNRKSGICQYFVRENSAPTSSLPNTRQFSYSPYVSGAF